MVQLEQLSKGVTVRGRIPHSLVTVVDTKRFSADVLELTYNHQFHPSLRTLNPQRFASSLQCLCIGIFPAIDPVVV